VTELRWRNETHDVPVVIVTGLGGAPDWTALEQLGASGFLVKPVAVDQLLSTVRRLLTTSE
jgi:DNA-binding NtrC family response regulator